MQARMVDLTTMPRFKSSLQRAAKKEKRLCAAAQAKERFLDAFTSDDRRRIAESLGLDTAKTDLIECVEPSFVFKDGSRLVWSFSRNVGKWKVVSP